jgi:hypothetical protein
MFVKGDSTQRIPAAERLYIPVLRTIQQISGLESHGNDNQDSLQRHIRRIYKLSAGSDLPPAIFTGQTLYKDIEALMRSKHEKRHRKERFETFLSAEFFEKRRVELVPVADFNEGQPQVHLAVHENDVVTEHPIHDFGDGIGNLIGVLYPIFVAPDGTWVFIEEPELNLHPGLQRILLGTIMDHDALSKKIFFVTTHSNHLLELAIERDNGVAIFGFERRCETKPADASAHERTVNAQLESRRATESFYIRVVQGHDTRILNDLGVRNASVFMSNCAIWVEGITDRIYVRAYLRCFIQQHKDRPHYREDIHYAFFEYGGSSLAHYAFADDAEAEQVKAQFLSSRTFLLADRDLNKDEAHKERYSWTRDGFVYRTTKGIEIENEISDELLAAALPNLMPKKITEADVQGLNLTQFDRRVTRLGTFLQTQLANCPKSLVAKGGTLQTKYKVDLARLVAKSAEWSNIGEAAQELAKAVYDFISSHNSP